MSFEKIVSNKDVFLKNRASQDMKQPHTGRCLVVTYAFFKKGQAF